MPKEAILRPRIDPAMGEVVICARVARQLAAIHFRHGQDYGLSPASAAYAASAYLPADYKGMLRLALHSLAVYLNLGWPSVAWLRNVLEASHYGHNFRRCFFFEYKDNRGLNPRVTNRGVQLSPSHYQLQREGD